MRVGNSLVGIGPDGKPQVLYTDPQRTAPERVTYGQPISVIGPDGQEIMVRPGSDGSIKPIEGFKPTGAKPTAPTGYRFTADGSLAPIKGGPADTSGEAKGPRQLTAEASTKVALLENALREATAYRDAVTSGTEFKDIAARMPENERMLNSAIRAKLRAESGATITGDEVSGELNRYGPKLFSADETNVDAVNRMIEDLKHQIAGVRGGQPAPAKSAGAGPQIGEIVDGHRYKGGDPASPNSWEAL
jgi:hypothetical protein